MHQWRKVQIKPRPQRHGIIGFVWPAESSFFFFCYCGILLYTYRVPFLHGSCMLPAHLADIARKNDSKRQTVTSDLVCATWFSEF